MRRELRPTERAETLTYSFHFQLSNKGGRQACSVEVHASNVQEATTFFRQNLSKIESVARAHLANGTDVHRILKLAAPGDPNMRAARRETGAVQRRPRKPDNSLKRVERSLRASPTAAGVMAEGQAVLS
jgi:hypothetical protein